MFKSAKSIVRNGLAILLVFGLVIQLIPYGRAHTNPSVLGEPAWDSPGTRALFFRGCGDCHSNETVWPWYAGVTPVSWLVQSDVEEGRAAFNVSEWGRLENEGDDAVETVREGSMPPTLYVLPHPSARLNAGEKQAFIAGLTATFGDEGGNEGKETDGRERQSEKAEEGGGKHKSEKDD